MVAQGWRDIATRDTWSQPRGDLVTYLLTVFSASRGHDWEPLDDILRLLIGYKALG